MLSYMSDFVKKMKHAKGKMKKLTKNFQSARKNCPRIDKPIWNKGKVLYFNNLKN